MAGHLRPIVVPDALPRWMRYRWVTQCTGCSTLVEYIVVKDGETIMAEGTSPTKASDAKTASRPELLEKVRRLSENIEATESAKKAASKDYNEELKALKDELHDTLDLLKDTPDTTGKSPA